MNRLSKETNSAQLVKLGEFLNESIQNGLYKPAKFYGQGVPIVRIHDFNNEGTWDSSEFNRLTLSDDEIMRFGIRPDDILINRVNSLSHLGKSVLVQELCEPTVFESNMMRLRLESDSLLPKFLAYYLQTSQARNHFRSVAKKAVAQASINQNDVKSLEIPLPPLPEQRKIADILGAWDEEIRLTERLIEAKQQFKKGLMQQLLTGKMRFPGFEGVCVEEKPTNWKEVRLQDIFSRVRRKVEREVEHVLSITAGVGFVDQREKFGRVIAGKNLTRYIHLQRDEFAYNKGNSKTYPQGCVYKLEEFEDGAVPNVYYCFKPKTRQVSSDFFKYYFENGALNQQLQRRINTGVRNDGLLNLSADDFISVKVVFPPLAEQEHIGRTLTLVDQEISLLQQKAAALREQKKGLMQQLLTGKVRV